MTLGLLTVVKTTTGCEFEEAKAVVVRKLPQALERRHKAIKDVFSKKDVALFNLSQSDIGDGDINAIYEGLTERCRQKQVVPIQFLDFDQRKEANKTTISHDGIKRFFELFQEGYLRNVVLKKHEHLFPVLHKAVFKVSRDIPITQEFFDELSGIAPHVFSDDLSITN